MGMFSTVIMVCPHCGRDHSEQSKAGECDLSEKFIHNADLRDVAELAHYGPYTCENCKQRFVISVQYQAVTRPAPAEEEDEY